MTTIDVLVARDQVEVLGQLEWARPLVLVGIGVIVLFTQMRCEEPPTGRNGGTGRESRSARRTDRAAGAAPGAP